MEAVLTALHKNARTAPAVRAKIAARSETDTVPIQCSDINEQTT